jgi:hypothetical protein
LLLGNRLLPGRLLHHLVRLAMGLPRHGGLRGRPAGRSGPPNP